LEHRFQTGGTLDLDVKGFPEALEMNVRAFAQDDARYQFLDPSLEGPAVCTVWDGGSVGRCHRRLHRTEGMHGDPLPVTGPVPDIPVEIGRKIGSPGYRMPHLVGFKGDEAGRAKDRGLRALVSLLGREGVKPG